MNQINEKTGNRAGWTIVELLTVMAVIISLIGLMVPALNKVRQFAKDVKQSNQFHAVEVALNLFNAENDGFPESEYDPASSQVSVAYCGAMKLCEAMVGQDLLGFHPYSHFRGDYMEYAGGTKPLYDRDPTEVSDDPLPEELKIRKGPYLKLENANANRIWNIYGNNYQGGAFPGYGPSTETAPFNQCAFVLCDVYSQVKNKETGKRMGMPLLYYKADTSGSQHPTTSNNLPINNNSDRIYYHEDNDMLLQLGLPWDSSGLLEHPMDSQGDETSIPGVMADMRKNFYDKIWNDNISISTGMPHRPESYILLSAGFDGEYGTPDDMYNFQK